MLKLIRNMGLSNEKSSVIYFKNFSVVKYYVFVTNTSKELSTHVRKAFYHQAILKKLKNKLKFYLKMARLVLVTQNVFKTYFKL